MADDNRMKPIEKLEDIPIFLKKLPQWGTFTKPISIRSGAVKNSSFSNGPFCHVDKDSADVSLEILETTPKTLICHDMRGGYLDDSYFNGTEDHTAYHFYHWSGIDIFCYFSHHFITIPPLGWINTAHAHGVKIIGTIITEWNDGFAKMEKILETEDSYKEFAHQMTVIAKYFKLEGWLLNIENRIANPDRLRHFISYFRDKLHSEIPGAELIWYDSVTVKGELKWQNKLNELNAPFFDACDGIFLNYSWYEEDLKVSLENSGRRKYDVYVGIDVWGRNFWGGGQFNTDQALLIATKYGLSLAIFAFAWTHESISPAEPILNEFQLRENAFWNMCWPFLYTRGPKQLPLQTSFCRGQGKKQRKFGRVVKDKTWFNLRDAAYQMSFPQCSFAHELVVIETIYPAKEKVKEKISEGTSVNRTKREPSPEEPVEDKRVKLTDDDSEVKATKKEPPKLKPPIVRKKAVAAVDKKPCLQHFYEDSFNGGSCLFVQAPEDNTVNRSTKTVNRLFLCDFDFKKSLIIYFVTKTVDGFKDQFLNVILKIKDDRNVVLCGRALLDNEVSQYSYKERSDYVLYPVNDDDDAFKAVQTHLLLNYEGHYLSLHNEFGWEVKYYIVEYPESTITEIQCELGNQSGGPILLGCFGVYPGPV